MTAAEAEIAKWRSEAQQSAERLSRSRRQSGEMAEAHRGCCRRGEERRYPERTCMQAARLFLVGSKRRLPGCAKTGRCGRGVNRRIPIFMMPVFWWRGHPVSTVAVSPSNISAVTIEAAPSLQTPANIH